MNRYVFLFFIPITLFLFISCGSDSHMIKKNEKINSINSNVIKNSIKEIVVNADQFKRDPDDYGTTATIIEKRFNIKDNIINNLGLYFKEFNPVKEENYIYIFLKRAYKNTQIKTTLIKTKDQKGKIYKNPIICLHLDELIKKGKFNIKYTWSYIDLIGITSVKQYSSSLMEAYGIYNIIIELYFKDLDIKKIITINNIKVTDKVINDDRHQALREFLANPPGSE